jgi:hypothetical protein
MFYRIWCTAFAALYLGFCLMEVLVAQGTIEPSFGVLEDFASRHDLQLRERLIAEKRAEAPAFAAFVFGISSSTARQQPFRENPGPGSSRSSFSPRRSSHLSSRRRGRCRF